MTLLLAVVGVGVVILGAVVLLLLPERPGGTIGWGGFQVNSRGAGLPLIVVGLVAIGFALKLRAESSTSTSPTSTTEPTVIYTAEFENQGRQAWTGGSYTDDGTYQLEAQRTDRPRVIASPPATAPTADNAGFSATARHAGGTAEEGYGYGIFCRESDENDLYRFTLWARTATIEKRVGGAPDPVVKASTETVGAADVGDAELELHAVCASFDGGSTVELKFWVTKDGKPQGETLERTDSDPLDESGTYGLFAVLGKGRGSFGDTLVAQFDDFKVTNAD